MDCSAVNRTDRTESSHQINLLLFTKDTAFLTVNVHVHLMNHIVYKQVTRGYNDATQLLSSLI